MITIGKPEPLPLQPILVLSPHLGGGVFSCGRLLASVSDAAVATLFAGWPPPGTTAGEWDRTASFQPGDDVVAARRAEDARALAVLGAYPEWMDFPEAQYGDSPNVEEISGCIETLLMQYGRAAVFFPLGLFHSDHKLVSDAALSVQAVRHPGRWWVAYEDAVYRRTPGLLGERLAALGRMGLSPRRVSFPEKAVALALKRAAVACYASQLRALDSPGCPGIADLFEPERYWWVAGSPSWGRRVRVRLRQPRPPACRLRRSHELVM